MDTDQLIQFTGIVVTYNEERRLRECLNSLAFCEQLLVIDLGSEDNSVEIARECGAEIIQRDKVSIVEEVRHEAVSYANNDWMIFLDPDEVFPKGIKKHLRTLIARDPDLGLIIIPWHFYFRGKHLKTTIWARRFAKGKRIVRHKRRNQFRPILHYDMRLLDNFNSVNVSEISDSYIKHYWADSYRQLFEKHWRYIKKEGFSRYTRGERFRWKRWVEETLIALKCNLINYDGMRGGFTGIFLSVFYAWYVNMSLLSLWRYQKRFESKHYNNPTYD